VPTNESSNDVNTTDSSTVDNDVYDETSEEFEENEEFSSDEDFDDQEDQEEYEDESDEESSASEDDSDNLENQKIPYDRFKEVNEKANQYKQEVEQLKPFVEAMQSVGIDHTVSNEDLANAVNIVKQLQTNPSQALESLMPVIQDLQARSGLVLSPELQTAVEQGEITEEYAYKISQAEANNANMQALSQKTSEEFEARQQQEKFNQNLMESKSVIEKFRESKAGDPDFQKMEKILSDKVNIALNQFSQSNGRLPTAAETHEILTKAEGECRESLKVFMPKRKASRVINNDSNSNEEGSTWRDRLK